MQTVAIIKSMTPWDSTDLVRVSSDLPVVSLPEFVRQLSGKESP